MHPLQSAQHNTVKTLDTAVGGALHLDLSPSSTRHTPRMTDQMRWKYLEVSTHSPRPRPRPRPLEDDCLPDMAVMDDCSKVRQRDLDTIACRSISFAATEPRRLSTNKLFLESFRPSFRSLISFSALRDVSNVPTRLSRRQHEWHIYGGKNKKHQYL